jgi:hypothetical protein
LALSFAGLIQILENLYCIVPILPGHSILRSLQLRALFLHFGI